MSTLERAIALAGGLTERASTKRITVVRSADGERTATSEARRGAGTLLAKACKAAPA